MKIEHVATLEAKTRLSALLAEVQKGRRFYITRHGKPIAELRPVAERRARPKAGFARGTFSRVASDFDAPLEDLADYME